MHRKDGRQAGEEVLTLLILGMPAAMRCQDGITTLEKDHT